MQIKADYYQIPQQNTQITMPGYRIKKKFVVVRGNTRTKA
jgi:hypothetical protein